MLTNPLLITRRSFWPFAQAFFNHAHQSFPLQKPAAASAGELTIWRLKASKSPLWNSLRRLSSAPPLTHASSAKAYVTTKSNSTELQKSSAKAPPPAKMLISLTCKVCSTVNTKFMSKQAYTAGVVILKCDGCDSQHLIADHLGWFDTTQGPVGTIEDIMRRKGETVARGEIREACLGESSSSSLSSPLGSNGTETNSGSNQPGRDFVKSESDGVVEVQSLNERG